MEIEKNRTDLSFNGLVVLYQIARILSAGGPLNSCMMEIMRILQENAAMNRGMISLLNSIGDELVVDVAFGIPDYLRQKGKYRLGEGITGWVAKTGKAMVIPKIKDEPMFLDRTGARKELNHSDLAFLCVPIKINDKVIGVLSVDRIVVDPNITLNSELHFLEVVSNLIAQVVEQRRKQTERIFALEKENKELKQILENRGRPDQMIGNSNSMRELYRYVAQVAPSITTVLIRGETGTGKELVARAIHQKSNLRDGPFIAVNCAALPESLLESELFGHEKGAFTGAFNTRIGKFEAAQNGTLFLDEIGELSLCAQGILLRAIQEKEFQRIGSMDNIRVNVRLIAATNRNLEEDVLKDRFREDLFYRLNVFTIVLPPLRERGADIFLLSDHFVKKYSKLHMKQVERISTAAIEMLSSYHWPGNVRELENVIERAVIVCEGNVIEGHDLPRILQQCSLKKSTGEFGTFDNLIASYEKELIIDALKDCDGNQTDAAKLLRTTKRIIQYKVEKYGIDFRKYRKNASSRANA
ncbi:MAG TPA: sigma 54-interacting transcriptional regulator [Chitinispirillaceae bacterium]|nr:sigma 54-interacting transcriptional regulator [Chitinispirillaceae bacterium]